MKTNFIAYALGVLIISSCDIFYPQGHRRIPVYNDSEEILYVTYDYNVHLDPKKSDFEGKYSVSWALSNYRSEQVVRPKEYNNGIITLRRGSYEDKLDDVHDTLYVVILEDDVIKEVLSHRKKEFHYLLYKLTLKDLEKLNWVVTYPPDNPDFKIKDVEYIVINDEFGYER